MNILCALFGHRWQRHNGTKHLYWCRRCMKSPEASR